MSNKKPKVRLSVEVVQMTTTGDFMLIVSKPGWFSAVKITEAEAEKTCRLMEIELQKKAVF